MKDLKENELPVQGAQGAGRAADPWKHRVKGMCCTTCMWFAPKLKVGQTERTATLGRCRRHAPTMSGYPVVFVSDWCGDHKLDEEKIP